MASIKNIDEYGKDEHFTPKEVFTALNCIFDMDVCGNSKAFVPARYIIELPQDGLTTQWNGLVWMNPPYSSPSEWIAKFIEHNNGIALVPVSRGKWWDKVWESDCVIIPSPYNFKFVRPDGITRDVRFRTMLFALGQGKDILAKSRLGKVR